MSHAEHRTEQNSTFFRCVDGRKAVVIIEMVDGEWKVTRRGEDAAAENGPQALGASLLFVKLLEVFAGKEREEAFDLTEQAHEEAGYDLQVHVDDHHGEIDFENMSDEEIIERFLQHEFIKGCGFAAYAWGGESDSMLKTAIKRGWRVQVLSNEHDEKGATLNRRQGETFDTGTAVDAGESQFNTDLDAIREVVEVLARLIDQPEFVADAMEWTINTYGDVVVKLKGVKDQSQILELGEDDEIDED